MKDYIVNLFQSGTFDFIVKMFGISLFITVIALTPSTIFNNLLKSKFFKNRKVYVIITLLISLLFSILYVNMFRKSLIPKPKEFIDYFYYITGYFSMSVLQFAFYDMIKGKLKIDKRIDNFLDSKGLKDKK